MNKAKAIRKLKAKMKKYCNNCNKMWTHCFAREGKLRDIELDKIPICWVKWATDLMLKELNGN